LEGPLEASSSSRSVLDIAPIDLGEELPGGAVLGFVGDGGTNLFELVVGHGLIESSLKRRRLTIRQTRTVIAQFSAKDRACP
jgi:hypothetical protein